MAEASGNDKTGTNNSDGELLPWLQLNLIPQIGPRHRQALLEAFGSPQAVLNATPKDWQQVDGLGPKLARSLADGRHPEAAERELQRCRTLGVALIPQQSPGYPKRLAEIRGAPSLLYCRGTLESRDDLAVAIVGTRHCTHYGRQQTERLAAGLANAGVTVVSGLARGIDAAAHRGALKTGGRTIAVMATGMSTIYPPEHDDLAEEITHQGALLSEFPLDQKPVPGLFPQRNRIISGISLGVVIVEASRKSGALHTARHALEQDRDVFAVPGRLDSLASQGCHDLIRDGAVLIRDVDDVLESLGPMAEPVQQSEQTTVHTPRELNLNEQEQTVLNLISNEQRHIDAILREADLDDSRVLSTLTVLEMKRLIRRLPGGFLVRATH